MKKVEASPRGPDLKGKTDASAVEAYYAALPEPARTTLNKMRATIHSAVPAETVEAMSYGMPGFRYKDTMLVWSAAFAGHCSFFPTGGGIEHFQAELKAYKTSKGTVQFALDKPMPAALVKKIVKWRVQQVEIKNVKKSR